MRGPGIQVRGLHCRQALLGSTKRKIMDVFTHATSPLGGEPRLAASALNTMIYGARALSDVSVGSGSITRGGTAALILLGSSAVVAVRANIG